MKNFLKFFLVAFLFCGLLPIDSFSTTTYLHTQTKNKSKKSKAKKSNSSYSPSASRDYIRGPRGGCYYINRNGNKTYVDRSLCN